MRCRKLRGALYKLRRIQHRMQDSDTEEEEDRCRQGEGLG